MEYPSNNNYNTNAESYQTNNQNYPYGPQSSGISKTKIMLIVLVVLIIVGAILAIFFLFVFASANEDDFIGTWNAEAKFSMGSKELGKWSIFKNKTLLINNSGSVQEFIWEIKNGKFHIYNSEGQSLYGSTYDFPMRYDFSNNKNKLTLSFSMMSYEIEYILTKVSNQPEWFSQNYEDFDWNDYWEDEYYNDTNYEETFTNGLVAYYKFEESGSAILDSSSYGNNGTCNAVGRPLGIEGYGCYFDHESSNIITVNSSDSIRFNKIDEFTIEAWVKITDNLNVMGCILDKGADSSYNEGYSLRIANNLTPIFIVGNGDYYDKEKLYGSTINENEWVHIAAVWNNGLMKLYQNGILVAQKTIGIEIKSSNRPLYIGNNYWHDHGLGGIIDELKIYNYDIGQSEILNHYNEFS